MIGDPSDSAPTLEPIVAVPDIDDRRIAETGKHQRRGPREVRPP